MGGIGGDAYAEQRDLNELVGELRVQAQQEGKGTKLGDGRKRRVTLAGLRTCRRDKSTLPIPIELAVHRGHLPSRSFLPPWVRSLICETAPGALARRCCFCLWIAQLRRTGAKSVGRLAGDGRTIHTGRRMAVN